MSSYSIRCLFTPERKYIHFYIKKQTHCSSWMRISGTNGMSCLVHEAMSVRQRLTSVLFFIWAGRGKTSIQLLVEEESTPTHSKFISIKN